MNPDLLILDVLPWLISVAMIYAGARLAFGVPKWGSRKHAFVVAGIASVALVAVVSHLEVWGLLPLALGGMAASAVLWARKG